MIIVIIEGTNLERVAEIARAALLEVGRKDLADLLCYHQEPDENGHCGSPDGPWYLEPLDEVSDDDYALMLKAHEMAGP